MQRPSKPTPLTCACPTTHRHRPGPAETANIPLEDSAYVTLFASHRFWRRVMGKAGRAALERQAFRAAAWRSAQVRGEARARPGAGLGRGGRPGLRRHGGLAPARSGLLRPQAASRVRPAGSPICSLLHCLTSTQEEGGDIRKLAKYYAQLEL